jgi:hypothetical protein
MMKLMKRTRRGEEEMKDRGGGPVVSMVFLCFSALTDPI